MSTRTDTHSAFYVASRRARLPVLIALLSIVFIIAARPFARPRQAQADNAAIVGLIMDDKNSPVAGAKVTLTAPNFSASRVTQADGKFEFRPLKPGAYRLVAEASRFRKATADISITRPDEVINQPPIQLVPSSLHATVVDASNQPLKGATVAVVPKERAATAPPADRKSADDSGDVYFGRLAPGSYQLIAAQRGYDEYRNDVFISSGITTDLVIQLQTAPVIPINEKAVTRYGPPNLPSKNVQAIFQDTEGWMWFGTDKGVARFNGTDFRSSALAGTPYEQLAGEDVRAIAEDKNRTIWFATARGVRRLLLSGDDRGAALAGQDVRHLTVDSQGHVWIATAHGLFKFDGTNFISLTEANGLPSNDVRATAEDKSGRIWIATAAGVAILEGDHIVPFAPAIDSDTETRGRGDTATTQHNNTETPRREDTETADPSPRPRVSVSPRPRVPASPHLNPAESGNEASHQALRDVQSLFVDAAGAVWMATASGVLVHDGNHTTRAQGDGLRNANPSPQTAANVRAIGQDRSGRMWFALAAGGVLLYEAGGKSQRLGFLDHDHVARVFTCREGQVWFGTDNGVVHTDPYSFVGFTTSRGLADNEVRAVVELPGAAGASPAGKLWFLTAAGVSRMQGERFAPVEKLSANLSAQAMAIDRAGSIWIATDRGALRLTGQTLTQFNEGNRLASNNVHWVTSVADGAVIVFATARGATLFKDGEMRPLDALVGYDVRHVFADRDGRLWFSTSRGVMSVDLTTGEGELIDTTRGLADNDVRWIARFNDRLLIATRGGVQVCARRDGSAISLTTFDSEPASTMFVDRDGYLWVGNDEGQIKKFALIGGYLVSTIYANEVYALSGNGINSFSQDSEGCIWMATDKGAIRHIPVTAPPPAQVAFEVDGRSEAPAYGEAGAYQIPYGRHKLSFHFAAVSMSGQVRYLYRISPAGRDEPWEALAVQQGAERDVSRTNLSEGAHTFELIALNRDLYGASAPIATIPMRVGSPFWKRWWFYALAFTLIGLALGAIFVTHRLREREYVLPKELRTYQPIEPNPFLVGNPIRTAKMFYGREDDFRYVRTKLEGTSQGVVIVFCGERRAGKSSILYQVLNGRLGDRFIPVFVDMQEMVITTDAEFFARISRLIAEAMARANRQIAATASGNVRAQTETVATGGPGVTPTVAVASSNDSMIRVPQFDGRNPYPIFLDFLDEVLTAIGDRTLLVMMDEYELMEGKVDEGKLSAELFTFLAGLMDNKEGLALIFTGSRRLEERDKKYWRELLRRSLFRKVGFLSENDTFRLITEPVEKKVVYGRGVVDVIYRLTSGQPFYTQVICQNIVDYLNEHEQNWVTLGDLTHVIGDIIDNPLPQMIYAWDGLSDDEKLALSLLAEVLPDGNDYAAARRLCTAVTGNDYPVNLSENTIRLTLEEMFHRELLDKDATDGFRFKIDLFRLWIRRSHSIWQVVKEVRTL